MSLSPSPTHLLISTLITPLPTIVLPPQSLCAVWLLGPMAQSLIAGPPLAMAALLLVHHPVLLHPKNLDIDECVVGSHDCGPNARCINIPGSFTCACNQGYSGDGFTCKGRASYS